MSGTHIDRKELKHPDAFQATTTNIVDKIAKHKTGVIGTVVTVILAGVFIQFYLGSVAEKKQLAQNAIYSALKQFEDAQGKVSKTDSSWENKLEKDIQNLNQTVHENSNNKVASGEAMMQLGSLYAQHAQTEKALEYYVNAENYLKSEATVLKMMAKSSAAYAAESLKKYDDAISRHEEIMKSDVKPLAEDSMFSLARLYGLKGDPAKARETYQKFILNYPKSESVKKAEILMNVLTASNETSSK